MDQPEVLEEWQMQHAVSRHATRLQQKHLYMVGQRSCRKQSRVQWFCSIILPLCVAQILCSQPGSYPAMIVKTKGKREVMEFSGYFARKQDCRTGFLAYQSPFILKLIPLGDNADTASAFK